MPFLSKMKNMNQFWNRIGNVIWKNFDKQPEYSGKYPNAKLKSYNSNINTDFHGKKLPKKDYICLAAIVVNTVCQVKNENDLYYSQILIEEGKYQEKKRIE